MPFQLKGKGGENGGTTPLFSPQNLGRHVGLSREELNEHNDRDNHNISPDVMNRALYGTKPRRDHALPGRVDPL